MIDTSFPKDQVSTKADQLHFSIDRKAWPLLCERIKELLSGQSALGLEPLAPQCEAEARRITARLLQRQGEETTEADWETVDVACVCDSDGRCVGVEHAALAALDMLGLPGLFDELGFNRRQRCCALANMIARMAHPGSERATNRWLRATSATGELLGLDFGSVSDMALYRKRCECTTWIVQLDAGSKFQGSSSWRRDWG